jgi:D-glycero-alpha-D-manno-heptose-7-phosphate kinase
MLTVAKSPLRVSFFGGGTDYPSYYEHHQGAVLGTAVDKYVYVVTLPMVGYAENRFRITYRTVEAVDQVSDIRHNAIRAVLQELGYDSPLNIATLSDLPGNSGLGSSSAFTVAFLKLVEFLRGREISKFDLMREAVRIELEVLRENVGIQDQTHASYGGLSLYTFKGREFSIHPVQMATSCRDALNEAMCLIYTGIQRSASHVLEEQMKNVAAKTIDTQLDHFVQLCHAGVSVLESRHPDEMLRDLGLLLSEGWETKRSLSTAISNSIIDEIYATGMRAGAYGGKLCGAGAGGFFFFLAAPSVQARLREAFGAKNFVKIKSADEGATVGRM